MWYVYYLRCADGSIYTGITNDLEKRVQAHNQGKGARYTRARLPVRLIGFERFPDKAQAASYERQFKQLSRDQKIGLLCILKFNGLAAR
jgi:putative endonuclease